MYIYFFPFWQQIRMRNFYYMLNAFFFMFQNYKNEAKSTISFLSLKCKSKMFQTI